MNNQKLLKMVESWDIKKKSEYRGFRCASCQRCMHKAWHIWFDHKKYKCEIHLCRECYNKYNG